MKVLRGLIKTYDFVKFFRNTGPLKGLLKVWQKFVRKTGPLIIHLKVFRNFLQVFHRLKVP